MIKCMGKDSITEKDWKELYKFCIDNGYRNLTQTQKELLKKAIEEARTVEDYLGAVFAAIMLNS